MSYLSSQRYRIYFFTIVFLSLSLYDAFARPVKLEVGEIFTSDNKNCGLYRSKWVSGKINKRGFFVPLGDKIQKLKRKARKQTSKKRKRTLKKVKKLRKKNKAESAACEAQSVIVLASMPDSQSLPPIPTAQSSLPPTPVPQFDPTIAQAMTEIPTLEDESGQLSKTENVVYSILPSQKNVLRFTLYDGDYSLLIEAYRTHEKEPYTLRTLRVLSDTLTPDNEDFTHIYFSIEPETHTMLFGNEFAFRQITCSEDAKRCERSNYPPYNVSLKDIYGSFLEMREASVIETQEATSRVRSIDYQNLEEHRSETFFEASDSGIEKTEVTDRIGSSIVEVKVDSCNPRLANNFDFWVTASPKMTQMSHFARGNFTFRLKHIGNGVYRSQQYIPHSNLEYQNYLDKFCSAYSDFMLLGQSENTTVDGFYKEVFKETFKKVSPKLHDELRDSVFNRIFYGDKKLLEKRSSKALSIVSHVCTAHTIEDLLKGTSYWTTYDLRLNGGLNSPIYEDVQEIGSWYMDQINVVDPDLNQEKDRNNFNDLFLSRSFVLKLPKAPYFKDLYTVWHNTPEQSLLSPIDLQGWTSAKLFDPIVRISGTLSCMNDEGKTDLKVTDEFGSAVYGIVPDFVEGSDVQFSVPFIARSSDLQITVNDYSVQLSKDNYNNRFDSAKVHFSYTHEPKTIDFEGIVTEVIPSIYSNRPPLYENNSEVTFTMNTDTSILETIKINSDVFDVKDFNQHFVIKDGLNSLLAESEVLLGYDNILEHGFFNPILSDNKQRQLKDYYISITPSEEQLLINTIPTKAVYEGYGIPSSHFYDIVDDPFLKDSTFSLSIDTYTGNFDKYNETTKIHGKILNVITR